jgi:murein DD-endopeptidase MepM/ murein hydrolase activator NlpD
MPPPIVYRGAAMTVLFVVVVVSMLATGCGGRAAGRPQTEPAGVAAPIRAQPAERLDKPAAATDRPAATNARTGGGMAAGGGAMSRPQRYYRLRKGQTLYSLARQHGIPVGQILAANGIDDPTRLPVGTVIYIPDPAGTPAAPVTAPRDGARPRPGAAPRPGAPDLSGGTTPTIAPAPTLMTLAWPIEGLVTGHYGARGRRSHHDGIDIDGHKGDLIRAVAPGRVVRAGDEGAYGKTVIIDHGDGIATLYAHASAIRVDEGDEVAQDEVIAEVGRTGNARGTHLHFEVRRNGRPVDPLPLLRSGVVQTAGP